MFGYQKALEQANEAKAGGNKLFVEGHYDEALMQYELALQIAPDMPSSVKLRSICHSNRGTCFSKLGKYEETIKECKKALELNPSYQKALIRRADAHEKLEHFEEAIADLSQLIELDPSNSQARITKRRLEPLAAAKREKMKEEMIGKLKDMGNSLLGRFGMSERRQLQNSTISKHRSLLNPIPKMSHYSIGALLDLKNNREIT